MGCGRLEVSGVGLKTLLRAVGHQIQGPDISDQESDVFFSKWTALLEAPHSRSTRARVRSTNGVRSSTWQVTRQGFIDSIRCLLEFMEQRK
jgi:hypothetical protein